MPWIVGLDLRHTGDGAVRLAHWFAAANKAAPADQAIGVHVLEEEHLRYVLRDHHMDEVVKGALEATRKRVADAGAGAAFKDVKVVQGLYADEALEEARAAAGAEGVIVGRAAPRGGPHVVRLGRVARRLLRTLASPVVVVPPDLEAAEIGDGPVIALTNLHEDAAGGCRFAADAARRLGRRWIVLHVSRGIEAQYLPAASGQRARDAHQAAAREALAGWLKTHGLQPDQALVIEGSPVEAACELAKRERAPLLVTGSRRLSTAERAVQTSFGSTLAANAPVAVAVVPPPG